MKPRSNIPMKTPLFFKVWFTFVAFLVVTIMSAQIYLVVKAVELGPEGIGRMVGEFVKGIGSVQ